MQGAWVGHVRSIKLCKIQPLLHMIFCRKRNSACFLIIIIENK